MAKVLERSLYQTDYYAWTRQQAAELRRLAAAHAHSTLDLANLAEEVESWAGAILRPYAASCAVS
jgi:hypothetical protein